MKKVLTGMVIFAMVMTFGMIQAHAQDKAIEILNSPWAPYFDDASKMPGYGIVGKIITEAYTRQGYKVKYKVMPWTRCLDQLTKGKTDAVATVYKNPEREKKYYLSETYMDSEVVFLKRKDKSITWDKLEDLKPYTIGVVAGYSYPTLEKADYLKRDVSPSEVANLRKLAKGRIDLIIVDRAVGFSLINSELPKLKGKFDVAGKPLSVNKLYVMFSKDRPNSRENVDQFNMGLANMKKDGSLKNILSEYGF